MNLAGRCHCGNIAFTLDWRPEPVAIPARACGCTFCQKHGGVWTSNPRGRLEVAVKDPAAVSKYAFGTRTADFHVCRECGVAPIATSVIEGRRYAVVSVRALEGIDPAWVQPAVATDFDGEDQAARLARRARNWIGTVAFEEGAR
jgi:hypothetical protein